MTDKEKLKNLLYNKHCIANYKEENPFVTLYLDDLVDLVDNYKEEPVSKDLEEAAENYSELLPQKRIAKKFCKIDFKAGAEWQKEQDKSTIGLAEGHAMLAGMEKMKEQIKEQINDIEVSMKAGLVKKREGSKKIAVLKPILSFIDSMQNENKINVCETSCPFKGIVTELPCWCCMYNKNKREE